MTFNNKAWFDDCYVAIAAIGGSEVQMCTKTNALQISGGNFSVDKIDTFCGTIQKVGKPENITISFDGTPVSNQDFDWIRHGTSPTGSEITASTNVLHRVSFLWTDKTGVTSATQGITGSEAYRQVYVGAYCNELEYSMDAGDNLTATCKFALSFEDANGELNFKKQSTQTDGSGIAALSAYTTSNKF